MTLAALLDVDRDDDWRDRRQSWVDNSLDRETAWLAPDDCFSSRNRRSEAHWKGKTELPDERLAPVATAIEKSRELLALREGWDGDDASPIGQKLWRTAIDFLKGHALSVINKSGHVIATPTINPLPDGTIDLHWKSKHGMLLINIRGDEKSIAEYYGDRPNGLFIKGRADAQAQDEAIIQWLMTL